jgi:two-component system sensor histidine kinase AtoS
LAFLATFGRHAALACETVGRHLEELSRERALQRAQQFAIAGQLAATVAHEVRNPLAAIRSTVQHVLTSERAWSRREELLVNLTDEIDRIDRTVNRILQISRPGAIERADVDSCTRESWESIEQPRGGGRGWALTTVPRS